MRVAIDAVNSPSPPVLQLSIHRFRRSATFTIAATHALSVRSSSIDLFGRLLALLNADAPGQIWRLLILLDPVKTGDFDWFDIWLKSQFKKPYANNPEFFDFLNNLLLHRL